MPNTKLPILDLFGEPDTKAEPPDTAISQAKKISVNATEKTLKSTSDRPQTNKKKPASKPQDKNIQQAFLPGLSRRGRPRSKHPISAVERTAEHRRKRLAEGSKRVEMILAPEVARQLDALAEQYKEPRSEVTATLVIKAYAKVFKIKPANKE